MDAPPLPAPVIADARAKINLYLRIGPTRPDGYHELATVFQTIELADTLEFTAELGRDGINLRTTHPDLPDGKDNLITRAYRLLRERYDQQIPHPGVICRITKRIPMQAGLGGGSSDAAATLLALNQLWGLRLAPTVLATYALELGSDVPFFLQGSTAFGSARGEELSALPDLPPRHLVLVVPPEGVSTAEAFGWWDAAHPAPEPLAIRDLAAAWQENLLAGTWIEFLHNDFEETVCHHIPSMHQIRTNLRTRGIPTVLTGSGSTFVGVFESYEDAARYVQGYQPVAGEKLILTRTVAGPGIVIPGGRIP